MPGICQPVSVCILSTKMGTENPFLNVQGHVTDLPESGHQYVPDFCFRQVSGFSGARGQDQTLVEAPPVHWSSLWRQECCPSRPQLPRSKR